MARTEDMAEAPTFYSDRWDLLPEHIQDAVERWITHGIPPGSFLTAVIENDLKGAIGRADEINRSRLKDIVSFFYNEAPSPCWGSTGAFETWAKRGGLNGGLL